MNADESWRKDIPKPGAGRAAARAAADVVHAVQRLDRHPERAVQPADGVHGARRQDRQRRESRRPDRASRISRRPCSTRARPRGTRLKLADDAAQIGTAIGTTSSMDSSRVQVRSLKKNAAAALDLLADVALHPEFPRRGNRAPARSAADAARRAPGRSGCDRQHRHGGGVVWTQARLRVHRARHGGRREERHARRHGGVLETEFRAEQRRARRRRRHRRRGTAQRWRKGVRAAGPRARRRSPRSASAETTSAKVVVVDLPGAPQTQLRVAAIGAPRSTPDYASLEVMDMILGGLFSSRINQNLRQDHGYTYGAYSLFQYRKGPGPFFVTTGVRTDATGPAVEEIFKELARMQRAQVNADELALGRDALVRSLPGTSRRRRARSRRLPAPTSTIWGWTTTRSIRNRSAASRARTSRMSPSGISCPRSSWSSPSATARRSVRNSRN